MMEGERELTTGLLSKDANFRLIVSGPIGVREIEMLIKKLQLDKEILADEGSSNPTARTRLTEALNSGLPQVSQGEGHP